MKVAIWIVRDREMLYDTETDELVFRELPVNGEERVDRVSMKRVLDAVNLAKRNSVNKKKD
jgi:hypothetical protein